MCKCWSGWVKGKQAWMNPIQSLCSYLKIAVHRDSPLSWRNTAHFLNSWRKKIQMRWANKDTSKRSWSYHFSHKLSLFKWDNKKMWKKKKELKLYYIFHYNIFCADCQQQITVYFEFRVAHLRTSWGLESFWRHYTSNLADRCSSF